MGGQELGIRLSQVRQLRGLSLKAVAEPAGISATYLQKLEGGEVRNPSPHVLHALAEQLNVPYAELMQLAGYVVPGRPKSGQRPAVNVLAQALSSEDLTEDELSALASYLNWHRSEQKKKEKRG